MILNSFAVLDGSLTLLRLAIGFLVFAVGFAAWRIARRAPQPRSGEDPFFLSLALGVVLVFLNFAGWPLYYALLQSYVSQWPDVMCVYGVTQIGSHSLGVSRFLPGIVLALQLLKPAIVFASGGWLVLYLVNRRTTDARLLPLVLFSLLAFAGLSVADALLEISYLVLPKTEETISGGCCTVQLSDLNSMQAVEPSSLLPEQFQPWLPQFNLGFNLSLSVCLFVGVYRLNRVGLWLLMTAAVISVPAGYFFLLDSATPAILQLPHHRCLYDLIPHAPECLFGVTSFLTGVFCVGWAAIAHWTHRIAGDNCSFRFTSRLLFVAAFAYLASCVFFASELLQV